MHISFSGFWALAGASAALAAAYPAPIGQSGKLVGETTAKVDIIAIEKDRNQRMTVPVNIEGKGPFSFVIDTGAERTVVSEMIAARLGLEQEEQVDLVSIAGITRVDTVYVPDMVMGKKNYGGLVAPILQAQDIGADGILGLDSLQNRRVLFDFVQKEITVEDIADVSRINAGYREIIVDGKRRSGQLIFTKATVAGIAVDVVIDTGGQVTIGNLALQKRLRKRARTTGDQSLLIAVTGDTLGVDMARVRDFRMDRAKFPNMLLAFADAPPFKKLDLDRKPAVLLGMDALRKFDKVAIDFNKRRVHLLLPKDAVRHIEPKKASRF